MPGLREWLGAMPGGDNADLSWDEVGVWLRERYINRDSEKNRRDRSKRRHELYMSAGDESMQDFIGSVFRDKEVIARRAEWVERAKFNNVLRRVVNELATVYSVPAMRTVGGETNNDRYQELQRRCRQHEMMRRVNRWSMLHRNLAVGFRVRQETDGQRTPVIDVVTPDSFFAVAHPLDPTRLVALGFDLKYDSPRKGQASPKWLIWTDYEHFKLDGNGTLLTDSVVEHGLGRMPWLLLSLEPPAGELLDSRTGEDLVAAHRAVWFQNILLLKESKSATKQPVIAGDITQMARSQAADSEVPIETPDGAVVSSVDFSMDLSMFRDTAQNIYETAAANHGLAPSILTHQGTQSAEARELMLTPLKELRREQQVYFREFERDLAEIQSMVLAKDLPEAAFRMDGWSVDFGEQRAPLDPKKALEVFEHERRLGLTDTVEEMIKRNPDLTVKQAFEELERHVLVEITRNRLMRPMLAISGSPSASTEDTDGGEGDDDPNGRKSDDDSDGRDDDAGLRAIDGGKTQ